MGEREGGAGGLWWWILTSCRPDMVSRRRRERGTDRQTVRDREAERHTQRTQNSELYYTKITILGSFGKRQTDRQRDRQTKTETDRQTDRDRHRDRDTQREWILTSCQPNKAAPKTKREREGDRKRERRTEFTPGLAETETDVGRRIVPVLLLCQAERGNDLL